MMLRHRPVRLRLPSSWGVFVSLLVGCLAPTDNSQAPLIQTDALEYELQLQHGRIDVLIPYTFTNRTDGPVYLGNCRGSFALHLERLDGAEWHAVWSPLIAACLGPPIVIEREEVWSGIVAVVGGLPGSEVGPLFNVVEPAGTYRIVWDGALSSYREDPPFGPALPHHARVSNAFAFVVR